MKTGYLTNLLDKQIVSRETLRDYIGASSIGSACLRQIYYSYHKFESSSITPRLKRIFSTGHLLEGLVLDGLESAGLKLNRVSIDLIADGRPYFRGHVDAIWNGNAIIEVKSAKNSEFNLCVKNGVYKWSPKYYAQAQSYMGMSGIRQAYVIVINKDTAALYDELIDFDEIFYATLGLKAQQIHEAVTEPPRVNNSPLFYLCKMCSYREICHKC